MNSIALLHITHPRRILNFKCTIRAESTTGKRMTFECFVIRRAEEMRARPRKLHNSDDLPIALRGNYADGPSVPARIKFFDDIHNI